MGSWYCVNCGEERSLDDFSTACACGGQAMACDEEHRFTIDELARMGHEWGVVRPSVVLDKEIQSS